MPSGSATFRAEQIELLTNLIHTKTTSKKFGNAIEKLIDLGSGEILEENLSTQQKAALREWRKDYLKAKKLPEKFVKEFAKLCAQSLKPWTSAKQDNAFNRFAPFLERLVDKCREKAEILGYQDHPYDALLNEYEPGTTKKDITALFNVLKPPIVDLVSKIASEPTINNKFLLGKFSANKQMEFIKVVMSAMGLNTSFDRLDFSSHPFSLALHPSDSRMTTRIHPKMLMESILSAIHEGGHSLYEMGLPQEHYGSPLCQHVSLGIHESQSRWWETLIGRSRPFWEHFFPIIKPLFSGKLKDVTLNTFYRGINKVEPGPIRIEADEVSYNLHIVVRFELECLLMDGSLSIRDLPDAWNEKMQQYLGVTPKNNAEGCLQDIHWAFGLIGYFPTYTLGNLYASQFFSTFEEKFPSWGKSVAKGDLLFVKEWLNTNIHRHGKKYSASQLAKHVTGKTLSSQHFIDYLTAKYSEIYKM